MRRWGSALAILVVVIVAAAAAFFFWPASLPDVAEARARVPAGQASIQRGEYIAKAADCAACHTLANGKPYAGGLPFHLPFGTIYATNITPDKETGIGNWSDAEFVRALHHGIDRGGQELYPAFPYTSYAQMSTEDALALKDYIFSLPAVHQDSRPAELSFPYNQRWVMRGWKLLFMPGGPLADDQGRSPEWNRGRYLVEALGHCGECHTPRNALFALDNGKKFAGALTAGWRAYNITSDREAGLGAWSDEQIANYLSTGHAQGRGSASGSMAEAVEYSLRFLKPEDIRAMVAYLRTVPAHNTGEEPAPNLDPPAVKASSLLTPPADEAKAGTLGLSIFQSACASCHAWNGEGIQHPHASLVGSQTVNDPAGTNLMQVLIHGSHLTTNDGDVFMPAFGQAYTDAELAAVANYVIGHFGGREAKLKPSDVAAARRLD